MAFMKFSKGKPLLSIPNGLGDGSAYFDGTTYAKLICQDLPTGSNPTSISAWFYQTSGTDLRTICGYGENSGSQQKFVMTRYPYVLSHVWGYDYAFENKAIEYNKWYHVVIVYENSIEKCYLNGELIGEREHSFNTYTSNFEFRIGTHNNDRYFIGNIKEVQVYNRALSADEVTQLYNKQEITSGRVLYVPLQYGKDDETMFTSKNFVYDYATLTTSSGFDEFGYPIRYDIASECGIKYSPMLVKDGLVFYAPLQKDIVPIIGNAPSLSGDATFGEVNGVKCLQCNGNTRIDYPQTDDLPTGNAPRTMSAWISSSYNRNNWDFACGFGGDDGYTMAYCFNGQRLRLYRQDMNISYTFIDDYPYDNTWVHCLTTFDGTTVKTYANGVLTFAFDVSYATSNRSVYLGYLGTQNAFNYYGNITSFRIYNRALTDSEIKALAREF